MGFSRYSGGQILLEHSNFLNLTCNAHKYEQLLSSLTNDGNSQSSWFYPAFEKRGSGQCMWRHQIRWDQTYKKVQWMLRSWLKTLPTVVTWWQWKPDEDGNRQWVAENNSALLRPMAQAWRSRPRSAIHKQTGKHEYLQNLAEYCAFVS